MLTITAAILLPFLAAICILLFLRSFHHIHLGWLVLIIPTLLFILFIQQIPAVASGESFIHKMNWIPSFDMNFIANLDGLSLLFGLLISGIGILVVLYSIYYLSADQSLVHFYIYLLLFMGSMLGIVFSDHLLVLYVFWELTSISSFLLIAFWYQRKGSRYGAKKALLITVFGGFSMLTGFLLLYAMTGTFSIQETIQMAGAIKGHTLLIPTIILILLGAFTKSAQFPFHIWLPDAMEAPTPISAYLHSATMVKAGIYLVARFTPIFGGDALWFWAITCVGLLTLFWAAFIAIRQTDLKALLAYSTISQLGLIMTLLGVGSLSFHPAMDVQTGLYSLAMFTALFHLMNHSTFKGALFMVVGIIDFQIGTRDLRRLGGLMAFMPITFSIALIGSFSMAGLPPFNGFLSKEMFFTALLHLKDFDIFQVQSVATIFPVIAWIASIFTFLYSMMIVFKTFFGPYHEQPAEAEVKEPSPGMLVAPMILGLLVILIFAFPNILGDYVIKPAILSIYPHMNMSFIGDIQHWHGFGKEVWMTIGIIIFGSLLYWYRTVYKKVYIVFPPGLSLDHLYNWFLDFLDHVAKMITDSYMSGKVRHYFIYIFVVFLLLIGGAFFYLDAFSVSLQEDQSIGGFTWIIAGTIILSSIVILFAKSRLTAIVVNGFIGYAIAMLFVIFRAPDLALTQLVIETVTTTLFLLCFYFLPEWKTKMPKQSNWVRWVIAIAVGFVFTVIALSVKSGKLLPTIASYYDQTEELTGAKNIVNTILGDFRAFDTMLEVIVLFIAGIGVFTLIHYSKHKGAKKLEDK